MPIYEYQCKKCGKRIEVLQLGTEPQPACGSDCKAEDRAGDGELERLISTPAKLTSAREMATGKIDYNEAAKKGFTTFKKQGKGKYERIAGTAGPEKIVAED